ncbi:glycosyltransferase [Candidatus Gracilibacteria bacterium]|nr:glycosyltransferase [Candidatus Gracilibacteria bacterium]
MSKLNIVMAGGGTGGHVFPIKSLIEFISSKSQYSSQIKNLYRFGEKNSLEKQTFQKLKPTTYNSKFIQILSGKYRRETIIKSRLKNVRDIFLFIAGFFQSLFRLVYLRVDVIFCKGGYVALPLVLAGALLRKKIIVHESDTHPGLVNKIASNFARKSFTGFDGIFSDSETVGQILSDEIIVSQKDIKNGLKTLVQDNFKNIISSINQTKTLVFVSGGSQGSKRLYQALHQIISQSENLKSDYIFFITLGLLNKDIKNLFKDLDNVYTFDFLSQKEMGTLCFMCDLAITRAGTTSLAEQKLYDMKIIMIPIPWTHDQYDNAKYYVKKYGDILVDQKDEQFLTKLSVSIRKYKNFKKKIPNRDRLEEISIAKEKIVREILNVNTKSPS